MIRKVAPSLSKGTTDDVTRVLQLGILVYRFANMGGTTELASKAVTSVFNRERYWLKADFSSVLETIFTTTENEGHQLRIAVLSRCIENHAVVEKFPPIVQTITKHEFVAWHFGVDLKIKLTDSQRLYEHTAERLNNKAGATVTNAISGRTQTCARVLESWKCRSTTSGARCRI
jgi:hypothetical protein